MQSLVYTSERRWKLPPLILHPFSDTDGPSKLMESSKASLMLQGLLPNSEFTPEQLEFILLSGRYCEVRMLYYVGKDLVRWIDQSLDFVSREEGLREWNIEFRSFAALLITDPPVAVREKLNRWGVADYRAIFSRAIGLNSVFAEAPEQNHLADEFIRNYYRYADTMFSVFQNAKTFTELKSINFDFDLYASGEYSRLLEREWQEL
jgi:hypothetical protein